MSKPWSDLRFEFDRERGMMRLHALGPRWSHEFDEQAVISNDALRCARCHAFVVDWSATDECPRRPARAFVIGSSGRFAR
jgi:hypothetical protein